MKKNIILLSTLIFSIFVYSQNSPRNIKDLRGWWKFDGNCIDSSGFKNNGTAFNCTYVLDRFNNKSKAIYLNGSNSVVKLDSTYFSGTVKQYLTFSFWVKLNNVPSSGYYSIFHKDGFWRLFAISINLNDKTISTGGSYPSPQQYWGLTSRKGVIANDTNWHNWTITYDAGLITFYKDGIKDTSGSTFNSIDFSYLKAGNSNSVNYLGAANSVSNGDHQFLKGSLDDVAYWGRVLNPCEIASLVNINFKKKIVSIGANTQSYCGKDSVKITATSGFKSYAWSNGKTGSSIYAKSTGTYTIAATDSQGCTVYDTAVISVLNPKISPRDTVVCFPSIVTLKASINYCSPPTGTIANGLVGWWPFCGNANDVSGNGNHATSYGGAALTTDRFGSKNGAYYFDGINDYLEGKFNNFPLGTASRSVAAWVKFNTKSNLYLNFIASWGLGTASWSSSGQAFGVYTAENISYLGLWPSFTSTPTGNLRYTYSFDTGKYYHIVVSLDATGNFKFYINSKLEFTSSVTGVNTIANNNIFRFGRSTHTNTDGWAGYMKGVIDEVGIWNRQLSSDEVKTLYNPFKYNWSNSDTTVTTKISQTGKSSVWVKVSNGIGSCYDTTTVRIQKPIVSIGKDTQSFCGVDSAKLTATSGFAAYNWSNGQKGASVYANATGPISVTATDSFGCSATDNALISVQNPRILPRDTIVCSGQAVTLRVKDTTGGINACATLSGSLKSGLVGWWPFCGNLKDLSTYNNDAVIKNTGSGTINFNSDRKNHLSSAIELKGPNSWNSNNSYLSIKYDNQIKQAFLSNYSVSFWLFADNNIQTAELFSNGDDNLGGLICRLDYPSRKIQVNNTSGNSLGFTPTNLLGKWNMLTITRDSTSKNMKIYWNGILVTQGLLNNHTFNATELRVGSHAGGGSNGSYYPFIGTMDDFGIWNKVLSSSEIKSLFDEIKSQYLWSTSDTTFRTRIQTAGTSQVWLKQFNGIGTCYDTTTVRISNPVLNVASDTLRFTNCKRDSLRLSVGRKWKSVQWSHGPKDSAVFLNTTGKYSVRVQDSVGCFTADTFNFINPGRVKASITRTDSVKCFNGSTGSASGNATGGFTPLQYKWSNGQAGTTATGLQQGNYAFIATDAYGCVDTVFASVKQPSRTTLSIAKIDSITCYNFSNGRITTSGAGGTLPYQFRWQGGQTGNILSNLPSGVYRVYLTDKNGCKDSVNIILSNPPEVIARIVSGNMTMRGQNMDVAAQVIPAGNYTYQWQPASVFGSNVNRQNATIQLSNNTKLLLTATNAKGCVGKDSLEIGVVQPVKDIIPNAFSPNKDGLNEGFGLPDIFEIESFYVYDRWGGVIFKGNRSNPRWNGYAGNELVPSGTYSYQITAKLKGGIQTINHTGKVTVVK